MYSRSKTPLCFNSYYRTEMKLVPIIMDYCQLQLESLKFFLGIRLYGSGLCLTLIFFNVNPQIFQQNCKIHLSNGQETNFHSISYISLRVIRRRMLMRELKRKIFPLKYLWSGY